MESQCFFVNLLPEGNRLAPFYDLVRTAFELTRPRKDD